MSASPDPVRIAAVGDVHMGPDIRGRYRPALEQLPDDADVLLVAGDLTQHGLVEEAEVFAEEFRDLGVPVVAVLGNHDYHANLEDRIRAVLEEAGIVVLEGEGVVVPTRAGDVGVAGAKGFCLGFSGRRASYFGEPEMKAFTGHGQHSAELLRKAFQDLDAPVRVGLTHFSPVVDTLSGEPPEIWAFLGNYLLGDAIDEAAADLAVHGHAHAGVEKGITPGGVPVRNVAQPVIHTAYRVYDVVPGGER